MTIMLHDFEKLLIGIIKYLVESRYVTNIFNLVEKYYEH